MTSKDNEIETRIRLQEEMIRRTLKENKEYVGMEVMDWKKKMKEHRMEIEKDEIESEEILIRAIRKKTSWELHKSEEQ